MQYQRLSEVAVERNVGNRLYVTAIIKNVEVRPMRTGGDSMVFIMKDKDVEYEGRVFGVTEETKQLVQVGKVYDIIMDVRPYDKGKGGISCIIENGWIKESIVPAESFVDWVPDINKYYEAINAMMGFVSDSIPGKIACRILVKYWNKFSSWPAASGFHHNSLGGLMMHTACVTENCYNIGSYYNKIYGAEFINLKLLISAALIHDIMKVEELEVDAGNAKVEYSTNSALESHIIDGAIEVKLAAKELGLEDKQEVKELIHCILAHHGKLEYGSPIVPNMPEAMILHYADEMDAEMWRYNKAFKGMTEHEHKIEWLNGSLKVYYRPTIGDNGLNGI